MTSAHLRPCPACARHARVSEDACPFCGTPFADSFRDTPRPQPPSRRLARAALFAVGSGTMVLTPSCSSSDGHGSAPAPAGSSVGPEADGGLAIAFYGSAPITGVVGPPEVGIGSVAAVQPDGGPCSTANDCGGGASCLFPIGGGCEAQGHCGPQESCTPQSNPAVLCVCGIGGLLELQCAPAGGYGERTTMGVCEDAGGAADASTADAAEDAIAAEAAPD